MGWANKFIRSIVLHSLTSELRSTYVLYMRTSMLVRTTDLYCFYVLRSTVVTYVRPLTGYVVERIWIHIMLYARVQYLQLVVSLIENIKCQRRWHHSISRAVLLLDLVVDATLPATKQQQHNAYEQAQSQKSRKLYNNHHLQK